jgi:transposase
MDSSNMNIFLQEVSRRHPERDILMFMDGAACHKSRETTLSIPENIHIEILPPYSPDCNPTENIWDEMREKFFRNTVYDSMDAVEAQLIKACKYFEFTPEKVQSITSFDWIVSNSKNAS